MKIEKEPPLDLLEEPGSGKKAAPKINKKPPREDSKVQELQQYQIDRRGQDEF
jgi:hypothetical protein